MSKVKLGLALFPIIVMLNGCSSWWGQDNQRSYDNQSTSTMHETEYKK
jgi:hypothetical protein